MDQFHKRSFVDQDWYELISREVYDYHDRPPWVYTVDTRKELESGKVSISLIRWKGRNKPPKKKIHKKLWVYQGSYTIYSAHNWKKAKNAIDYALSKCGLMPQGARKPVIDSKIPQINDLIAYNAKTQEELDKKNETIRQLRQKLLKANRDEIKKNFHLYKGVLKEFKKLVDRGAGETEIRKFLKENNASWIFGFEYEEIESEVWFPPSLKLYRFDHMLKRYDGFSDVLELKGANIESVFTKQDEPIAGLKNAIMQVIKYLYACDKYGNAEIFKPRGFIVMGRGKKERKLLRLLSHHLHGIEVKTYIDVIERAEMTLSAIKEFKG